MDNFIGGKYSNGTKYYNPNQLSTKFMLNMDSTITKDMKFTGRLSMFKNWASTNGSTIDATEGRRANGSEMFVERAYVDYTAIKGDVPVIFTIGRQPSSDGLSHQFKDNTVRKSTYSAMIVEGNADGLLATIDLKKATGMENAAVRFAYTKLYQAESCTAAGCSSTGGNMGTNVDTPLYGIFVDGAIPNVSGSLVQVAYVKTDDIVNPQANGTTKSGGDLSLFNIMVELTNFAESGVDIFGHYGVSKSNPTTGVVGLYGAQIDGSGSAYWLGGRYDLSRVSKGFGKIGYEYNHGSKNWTNLTGGSYDITNKLATRGSAHEVYYIQPINKFAYAKLGAQMIKYDYTGSGRLWGAPLNTGSAMAQGLGSAALKELQNIYLNFNLQY